MQNPKANDAIYNSWHLFMMLLRCEKVMIDLIIINQSYSSSDYDQKLLYSIFEKERPIYYKKMFSAIIDDFAIEFNINEDIKKELIDLWNLRNTLWHSKPSLNNFNIYITPENNKLKMYLREKYITIHWKENSSWTYSIKLWDWDVYDYYFKEINKFDWLFKEIAWRFKINYNWIQ